MESIKADGFSADMDLAKSWALTDGDGYKLEKLLYFWNASKDDYGPKLCSVKIYHSEKDETLYVLFKSSVGTISDYEKYAIGIAPYFELEQPEPLDNPATRWFRFRCLGAGYWDCGTLDEAYTGRLQMGPDVNDTGLSFINTNPDDGIVKHKIQKDEANGIIYCLYIMPFDAFDLTADTEQTFANGSKEFSMEVWKSAKKVGNKTLEGISFEPRFSAFGGDVTPDYQATPRGNSNQFVYNPAGDAGMQYSNSWASRLIVGSKEVDVPVAIEEAKEDSGIIVTDVEVRFAESTDVAIYNATGVMVANYSDVTSVNTTSLTPGIYFVQSGIGTISIIK